MEQPMPSRIKVGYFGKLRTRGDFVKNNVHSQLMSNLDDWSAHALEALRRDPHWQHFYDALPPLRFLMLGTQRKLAVGGFFVPSQDSSGRRFPFLCAAPFEALPAVDLAVHAPLLFRPVWNEMVTSIASLLSSEEPSAELHRMDDQYAELYNGAVSDFDSFLRHSTLQELEAQLLGAGHQVDLHNLIIALGELLAPLKKSNKGYAERGLMLPMPEPSRDSFQVASFWMSLVVPFLRHSDFELTVFYGDIAGKPRLTIGLLGADPNELACLLSSPSAINERFINLDKAPWVDQLIGNDSEKNKLSSYLRQERMILKTLYDTFSQIYYGV